MSAIYRQLAIGFGFIMACVTAFASTTSYAEQKPVPSCPYLMKDDQGQYYDYSSMYRDADLVVIARISSVSSKTSEEGLMTADISQVIKGNKDEGSILIPYTHNCGDESCNSDIILPTTREYLFLLKKTTPKTATRIVCPYQAFNGWVDHGDLHFSELYSVPVEVLKSFLESDKAVVQVP